MLLLLLASPTPKILPSPGDFKSAIGDAALGFADETYACSRWLGATSALGFVRRHPVAIPWLSVLMLLASFSGTLGTSMATNQLSVLHCC